MDVSILIKNVLLIIIILYAVYVVFGAYILFFLPISHHKTSDKTPFHLLSEDVQNKDHVLLLEDGFESGQVRMQAIKEAQSSIDFISYSVQKGKTSHLFMAELFEAADRGVHVRVLLDGLFHNLRGDLGNVREAIAAHPNMELRYYEPFKLFKPWSWHNRLHDKLLIIDETYGIIGGRNIGDKYLSKNRPKDYVYDRDVLVYNKNKQNSSLLEMKAYANELWEHPFTKQEKHAKDTNSTKGNDFQEKLKNELQLARDENDAFVRPLSHDWMNQAIQADHISFVSNPLTRLNKYPYLWKTFTELATNAESKVYMQTPYAIPTNQMIKHVEMQSQVQHDMMTNSIQQTPNPMAFSGYLGTRDEILNSGVSIYEYKGNYSIHAKSFVIDDYLSMVGSFNLDARSSFLNTESAVLIQGSEFAKVLQKKMDQKKERSDILTSENSNVESKETFKKIAIKVLSKVSIMWRVFL